MVHRLVPLVLATVLGVGLAGCEGDDGRNGSDGAAGSDGTPGLNCWDLNGNGVADLATEDTNKDGVVDVNDCRSSGVADAATFHEQYFTANSYSGTGQCLNCHSWLAGEVMSTGHWKWKGTVANIVGPVDLRGRTHGKLDLINNFCQAVPANEGRCSQCHIGYGWADKSFDFGNPRNIDCLACHDQTGTYEKVQAPSPEQPLAGGPKPGLDLDAIARSVGMNEGKPPRSTCVFCHSRAGGDDNVKHGDISSRFAKTAPDDPNDPNDDPFDKTEDVHMGVDGQNMLCVDCHQVDKDASGNVLSHGIGGFAYHSVDEGTMKDCTDCHEDRAAIHFGTSAELVVRLSGHDRLACQVCHIPAIARKVSTYTDWRWSDAGLQARPANCAAEPVGTGNRGTWSQLKGCFTWGNAVRPVLRYHNGTWNRRVMGISDTFALGEGTPDAPVDLGSPAATYRDANAMIYPFKKMTGNQPADATNNTILVPHLWGKVTGPNPFWRAATDTTPANVRWDLSLIDGAAYSGAYNFGNYEPFKPAGTPLQTYSGSFTFVDTVMLLKVDHEIPPAEQALGMDNDCNDCHGGNQVEWTALGYSGDPLAGGTRPE
jgi:hypothetical protein